MHLSATPAWQTDRVELFLLEPEHVGAAYVRWLNDPEVMRFLESRFQAHTEASSREFVQRCLEDPQVLLLGIRSVATDRQHVGNIKIEQTHPPHRIGDVGILIGQREAWGHGIASDAIATLCEIARVQLSLRKLTAGCYESNVGSHKAFAHAGFVGDGVRRNHFLLDGKPENVLLMARWLDEAAPDHATSHAFEQLPASRNKPCASSPPPKRF